jgi:SAM-dependent methyltransferase
MCSANLDRRSTDIEWMDNLSIQDTRLTQALADLRIINRHLGGYATSIGALKSAIGDQARSVPFYVLDIGCGGGDFIESLLLWADKQAPDLDLRVVGLDYNKATVDWACDSLRTRLPQRLFERVHLKVGDAMQLPFANNSVTIAHCSLFMHHFNSDQIVTLLRHMMRVATRGIVVNDLHRHTVAHCSISLLTRLLGASAMVRHDGPLSVKRAFSRDDLTRLAAAAGISNYSLTWHWAFRWLLTTVDMHNV